MRLVEKIVRRYKIYLEQVSHQISCQCTSGKQTESPRVAIPVDRFESVANE